MTGTAVSGCLLLFALTMLASRLLAGSILIFVVAFGSPLFFVITCASIWVVAKREVSVLRKGTLIAINVGAHWCRSISPHGFGVC